MSLIHDSWVASDLGGHLFLHQTAGVLKLEGGTRVNLLISLGCPKHTHGHAVIDHLGQRRTFGRKKMTFSNPYTWGFLV